MYDSLKLVLITDKISSRDSKTVKCGDLLERGALFMIKRSTEKRQYILI